MKSVEAPEDLHKLFAKALNSGDLDALVALYAFDGLLMTRGGPARGIRAIRSALAEYVEVKPTIQLTTRSGQCCSASRHYRCPRDSRSGSSTEIGQQVPEEGAVTEKSLGVDVLPGL